MLIKTDMEYILIPMAHNRSYNTILMDSEETVHSSHGIQVTYKATTPMYVAIIVLLFCIICIVIMLVLNLQNFSQMTKETTTEYAC